MNTVILSSKEQDHRVVYKAFFFLLTAIYLCSLTFNGVLIRQICVVAFLMLSLLYFVLNDIRFGYIVYILTTVMIFIAVFSGWLSPNIDWRLKVFDIFSAITFCCVAYVIYNIKYLEYFFHFFLIVLTILILRCFMVSDENQIFFHASRNIVATYLIFPVSAYVILNNNKMRNLFFSALCFAVCCILQGRTGIILSGIVFLLSFYLVLGFRLAMFAFLGVALAVLLLGLDNFDQLLVHHTNFSEGLKTARNVIYSEYFHNFTFQDFLFGRSFDGMQIINVLNNNPHNSFLLIHSLFGFMPLFLLIVFFVFSLFRLAANSRWKAFLLFPVFPVKAMTDSVIFFGLLDVIYISAFLMAVNIKNDEYAKKI